MRNQRGRSKRAQLTSPGSYHVRSKLPRSARQASTVSTRVVQRLIEFGVSLGVERELLESVTSVPNLETSDPDARIPLSAQVALWQLIARHVPDPGAGVRGGASFRVRDSGLLGYAVSFAPTLRDALGALGRFIHIFSEAVDVNVNHAGGRLIVMGNPSLGPAEPLAQDYRLASILQISRDITGIDIVPTEVTFSYQQRSSIMAHRAFFRCPMRFGTQVACIKFSAADQQLSTRKADATLAGYLGKHAERVLASLDRGQSLRHRVRAVIWSQSVAGKSTVSSVAATLGMSARTLQRQLREEGTSLSQELQDVRRTLSTAVLKHRDVAIDEVAFLLGYAEPSAFYRSFKRWTGQTPQQFRGRVA